MQFHYRMVLTCPICGGCGLNHWRVVKAHIKTCALAQPTVAETVKAGEPLWKKSDWPLKHLTKARETDSTCSLTVWPDPPYGEEASERCQIIECVLDEWPVQVDAIKAEAAAAEAKSKHTTHKGKGSGQKGSSKKVDLGEDDLDVFFHSSQKKSSQGSADAALDQPPQKPEEAEQQVESKDSSQ